MKGIVTVTPKSPGTLRVTVVDADNRYNIHVDQLLSFDKPGFSVALSDTVEFDAISGTTARVTRVLAAVA